MDPIYIINAVQMQINAMRWAVVNTSWYINTPMMSMSVGAMYCKKPRVTIGMILAPKANSSRGTAVAIPVPMSNIFVVERLQSNVIDWFGSANK